MRLFGGLISRLGLMTLLASLLVSILGSTALASPQTLTILGAYGSQGDTDPYTDFSLDGGTTWNPAYLSGWHPWGFVPGTNSWINCDPNPAAAACLNRTVLYRVRFNVPSGWSSPQMQLQVKADNAATMFLNGTQIGSRIEGVGGTTADATLNSVLQTGLNEIRLVVEDWGGLAGFNYRIDLNIDAPTPPTTLPGGGPVDSDGDGVNDDVDRCANTVLPDDIPTVRLGTNRWADVDGDGVFDTQQPKGKGPDRSYTIQDTGGCSARQIADALNLGEGHYKFGLSISAMDEWLAYINR